MTSSRKNGDCFWEICDPNGPLVKVRFWETLRLLGNLKELMTSSKKISKWRPFLLNNLKTWEITILYWLKSVIFTRKLKNLSITDLNDVKTLTIDKSWFFRLCSASTFWQFCCASAWIVRTNFTFLSHWSHFGWQWCILFSHCRLESPLKRTQEVTSTSILA